MSLNYQKDPAMQAPTLPTGLDGVDSIVRFYQDGTEEVKTILKSECSIIYECSYCRSMFRSIINFLTHKRTICRSLHSTIRMEDSLSKQIHEALQQNQDEETPPPSLEVNGTSTAASKVKKAGAFLRRVNMVSALSRHIRPINVELPNTKASIELQTLPKLSRPTPITSFHKARQIIHHPASTATATAVKEQMPEERTVLVMPQDHSTRYGDMQLRKRRRKGATTAHTSLSITTKEVNMLERIQPDVISLGDFHTLKCLKDECAHLEPFTSIGELAQHLLSCHSGAVQMETQKKRAYKARAGKEAAPTKVIKVKGGGRWPKKTASVEISVVDESKKIDGLPVSSSSYTTSSREESEISEEAPLLTAEVVVGDDASQPRRQMQRDRRPTKRIFNEQFAFPRADNRLSSLEIKPDNINKKGGGSRQVVIEVKKQRKARTSQEPPIKKVAIAAAAAPLLVANPEKIKVEEEESTPTPSKCFSEPPELHASPRNELIKQRGRSVIDLDSREQQNNDNTSDLISPTAVEVVDSGGGGGGGQSNEEETDQQQITPTKPFTKDQLPSVLADRHRENLAFYTPRARKSREGGEGSNVPRRKQLKTSDSTTTTTPLPLQQQTPPPKPDDLTTVPVYLTELQRDIFFSPLRPLFSTKTGATDGLHQCGECGETLRCLRDGRRHMVGHLRVMRIRCSLCDAGAFFCSDMRIHIMFRHCDKLHLAPEGFVHADGDVVPCMDKQKADALSQLVDPYHPGRVMYTSGKIVSWTSPKPYFPDPTIEKRILSKSSMATSSAATKAGPSSLAAATAEEEDVSQFSEETL